MRAVFSGGGTAGHIIPGIALGRRLLDELPGSSILFITLESDSGSAPLARSGFMLEGIKAGGLLGKNPLQAAAALARLGLGFFQSVRILRDFKPDIVIGNGGYVSAPPVAAGLLLGRKVVLMEQNLVPGLVTRLFARFSEEVELSFAGSARFLGKGVKWKAAGNPLRPEIFSAERKSSMEKLGLCPERPVLAVLGGSSGAASLNRAMEKFLTENSDELRKMRQPWQFIHLAGEKDFKRVNTAYKNSGAEARVFPFTGEIWDVYASADLVLSRSGGNSVAEISARGLPAVYVPYPGAGGHQEKNALDACARGAAVIVKDDALDGPGFGEVLFSLMAEDEKRRRMSEAAREFSPGDAAGLMLQRIVEITGEKREGKS